MARRPYKVAGVALANKISREIWALLVEGGIYQAPAIMTKASGKVPKRDEPEGRCLDAEVRRSSTNLGTFRSLADGLHYIRDEA